MSAAPTPHAPRLWQTPKKVEIALTGACNLTCGYCSYGAQHGLGHKDDLPTERWLAFLDELSELGVMSVILTGGEPLLRPDFLEIALHATKRRMRVHVNTNGTLLDERTVRALVETGRLDRFQISLDGHEAWGNDRNRGKGAFAGALRGLDLLAALDAPRSVNLTITRFTADGLAETLEMLLARSPFVGTNEVMPFGRGDKSFDHLSPLPEQRPAIEAVLSDYALRHPGRVNASAGPLANARAKDRLRGRLEQGEACGSNGSGHLSSCGGFHDTLAVLHDGSIVPCIQIPSMPLGKVGEVSLETLWLGHALLEELRGRWEVRLESVEYCKGCEYIPFCHGGCPANAIATFGTHLAPDPLHCLRRLIDGVEPDPGRVVRRGGGVLHLRVV